jgi:ubiquinone/menaquinone biosynthesis C-methylase UbiE
LEGHDEISLVTDHAEHMPWASGFFDVVTCVFLMHELPPRVRRAVAAQIVRVLAPGGTAVICDSAQYGDGSDIKGLLDAFPRAYHEPFYKGYLRDDLARQLTDAGLETQEVRPALLSKVVVARKPLRTRLRAVS